MRISDWSSDVCSSDLEFHVVHCCNRVDSMTDYSALLKPDQGQAAHSLHLIDSKRFEDWLKTQPERCRAALSAQKFIGKGLDFAILPGEIGRASCRERVCQSV